MLRWQVVKTVLGHNISGGRQGAGRNLFDMTLLCKDAHGTQGASCNWIAFSGDRNPVLGEKGTEAGGNPFIQDHLSVRAEYLL